MAVVLKLQFLVLMFVIVKGTVAACPMVCHCNARDGYHNISLALVRASCQHLRITDIPQTLPTNLGTLIFKSNSLKTLKISSLRKFPYLKRLNLMNNGLQQIEIGSFKRQRFLQNLVLQSNELMNLTAGIFQGLTSLEILSLQENSIRNLPRGVFRFLSSLRVLRLHDNDLGDLVDGVFDGLDFLVELHLGDCRIKILNGGTFGNLMSLATIDLSYNAIVHIHPDTFSCAPALETLHLNRNNLTDVPKLVLQKVRFLKDLDLSENPISHIPSRSFARNKNLEILNVSFCNLRDLQEGAFEGLKKMRKLSLKANPFECDCRLTWLSNLLTANGSRAFFDKPHQIECKTPSLLSGEKLMDVKRSDLTCACSTCQQHARCNSDEDHCTCNHGTFYQSCDQICHSPTPNIGQEKYMCHYHMGHCLCTNRTAHRSKQCDFQITQETCSTNAKLMKIDRILECVCNKGFSGNGVNCSDVNECESRTHNCIYSKSICINTIGGYMCDCYHGYKKSVPINLPMIPVKCIDINECRNTSICGAHAYCSNKQGSFECLCNSPGSHFLGNSCQPGPLPLRIVTLAINATACLVQWSVLGNTRVVQAFRILYLAFGSLSPAWTRGPLSYPPNTTHAVLDNLLPDTTYSIQIEIILIYNSTVKSEVQMFSTPAERSPQTSFSAEQNNDVITVSAAIGAVVAMAIAVALLVYCWNKRKPRNEGREHRRPPYLQDLIELRMLNRDVLSEVPEGTSNVKAFHDGDQHGIAARVDVWEISRDRLTIGTKIGEGQFGIVLHGALATSEGPMKVAVKTIKGADRSEMKDFLLEMEMMKEIGHHPNVVSLLGVASTGTPLYIIAEYIDGGNLLDLLRSSRSSDNSYANISSTLNSRDLLVIALDVSRGMSHIASRKLVHRDLAARNVLMTSDMVAKIADFGLTRDIYCEGIYVKTGGGRLPIKWMAPDAIKDQTYTIKSDVWSFGVLLWEIVTLGSSPYPGIPVNVLLDKLLYGYRMPQPEHCSDEVYSIMQECWSKEPSQRPDFQELCEMLSMLLSEEGRNYINIIGLAVDEIVGNAAASDEETS